MCVDRIVSDVCSFWKVLAQYLDLSLIIVAHDEDLHLCLILMLNQFTWKNELGILFLMRVIHEEDFIVRLVFMADKKNLGFR